MNRHVLSALAALSLLAFQSPANAQIVKVTASGVVSAGFETAGALFDDPGSVLTGDAFSYTATYNIAHAGYFINDERSDIYGGAAYSYLPYDPPSLGGGVLTINGRSQAIAGQWNSWIFAGDSPTYSNDFQTVQDYVDTDAFSENNAVLMYETPASACSAIPTWCCRPAISARSRTAAAATSPSMKASTASSSIRPMAIWRPAIS